VCARVCVYIYMHAYLHEYTYTYTYTYTHTHTYTYTHTRRVYLRLESLRSCLFTSICHTVCIKPSSLDLSLLQTAMAKRPITVVKEPYYDSKRGLFQ
jgi:hypothetical protein